MNNVLLIEDSPADTLKLREMLRQADDSNFTITFAGPLAAALEQLNVDADDLVLLSLSSPTSHGAEAVKR